ncbi:MAG: DinB family protein [Ignavibacteria bacterium]
MEYKLHFTFLLNYDYWANERIIESVKENNISTGKPIALLSHIINAEILTIARIKKTKYIDPFEVRSIENNMELSKSINSEWLEFINSLRENEFNNLIEYDNIKGEHITAKIWEMFLHMINHSTYHRGQIATSLRIMNITPPASDLMNFSMLNKE